MDTTGENPVLESLAREAQAPLSDVIELFEHEREVLSQDATITNYIDLLAARRVRHQLTSRPHRQ